MTAGRRQAWRQQWLNSINELTSLDLQKDTWLDATNRNPHWSFVEFMCCYFDDLLGDDEYIHYIDNGFVTKEEYEAIKKWHAALTAYEPPEGDYYDHKAVLEDLRWQNVIQHGVYGKTNLNGLLPTDERELLNGRNVA